MGYRRVTASGILLPTATVLPDEQMAILKQVEEAIALHERGVLEGNTWAAEKAYRRILQKHPGHARATALLGLLLQQKQAKGTHNPAALAMMAAGAEADPNDAMIHANYGAVLYHLGRVREAIESYRKAVEAFPLHSEAYSALGIVLTETCDHEAAMYAYERALAVHPDNYGYWCDLIFIADLAPNMTFESSLELRRRFNDRMVRPRMWDVPPHTNDRDPDRRLKIGYVSADMYQHSGAMTWGGFLVNHDRSQFHVTLYSATKKHDQMTEKFKASCDQWYDIQNWSDERLALQIRNDEIDILVDLASFTAGGRLLAFAMRPAPIQVSGWGYATGLGLDCMDYFATDAIVVPPAEESRYVDVPWRLPCALSWVRPSDDMPVGHVRAALGRRFTFGVVNRQPKITRQAIKVWSEILKRVPDSRLMLKNQRLESEQVREIVWQLFANEGITQRQVGLFGGDNHYDHLASHWVPDVMLDPFPQGGGVSSFESLWMGVPIVTLTDERPPGRITTSLLHQVDLADWACGDTETYIERAVAASQDIPGLIKIRESLRERLRGAPALRLRAYSAAVEKGFRGMWQRYLAQTADQEAA